MLIGARSALLIGRMRSVACCRTLTATTSPLASFASSSHHARRSPFPRSASSAAAAPARAAAAARPTAGAAAAARAAAARAGARRAMSPIAASTANGNGGPMVPSAEAIDGPDDSPWRPHALTGEAEEEEDWVRQAELDGAKAFDPDGDAISSPPRYLVLYGSLRERSYSRLLAFEFARLLEAMGGRVRVFDPAGLPVQGSCDPSHPKVQELRSLAIWAQGYVWVSPEQHGAVTAVFKNQIDWIPLSIGSVRPTQGRTVAVAQVCGGSQSFNAVNTLRLLARWMRCVCVPNQSSIPKAWTAFDPPGRLMDAEGFRDRVVDVAEELHKFTLLTRNRSDFLVDRFSERREKAEKGRLLSQAEKESEKKKAAAAAAAASS